MLRLPLAAATAAVAAGALVVWPTGAAADQLRIDGSPGLTPSFRAGVSDYVASCGKGRSLDLSVHAPPGVTVSVDGSRARSGDFHVSVPLEVGQATTIVATDHGSRRSYHVRCLPAKFPRWTFERSGTPQAQWYLMAPVTRGAPRSDQSRYVTIFDPRGVPVWWKRDHDSPFNSVPVAGGNLAWTRYYGDPFGMRSSEAWEIHRLDGKFLKFVRTVGSPPDTHDMEPLPGGDYLLITYRLRRDVDLSRYGRGAHANVFDGEIQEIAPDGRLVWSWNSKDHVSPGEMQAWSHSPRTLHDGTHVYDIFHMNSVAPDGNGGLVISARHVCAIYRIDMRTGAITWKLGGTRTLMSLRVVGDSHSPTFGLQHDARVLRDGTITVYDNRTDHGHPRAARFSIDTLNRTATLLENLTEGRAKSSGAQGSARRLPRGNWVVSWGGNRLVTEIAPSGRNVWRLRFADAISYRVTPLLPGTYQAAQLRRAMDQMHPRRPAR